MPSVAPGASTGVGNLASAVGLVTLKYDSIHRETFKSILFEAKYV